MNLSRIPMRLLQTTLFLACLCAVTSSCDSSRAPAKGRGSSSASAAQPARPASRVRTPDTLVIIMVHRANVPGTGTHREMHDLPTGEMSFEDIAELDSMIHLGEIEDSLERAQSVASKEEPAHPKIRGGRFVVRGPTLVVHFEGLPLGKGVSISLYDVAGRRLSSQELAPSQEVARDIDLGSTLQGFSQLQSGVYFLDVRAGAERVSKQLVIAR